MVDNVRASPYQQTLQSNGYLTANQIGHIHRFDPCQNFHNSRTTIYDHKAPTLLFGNQLGRNDNYITTNQLYHKAKYFEDCYVQPQHPKAPGINNVDFIKPEFHKRVDRSFNLDPIHDTSETREQFRARRQYFDFYGGPRIYTPTRDIIARSYKDYIYPFDPAENSVLKLSYPYTTTNMVYHRDFPPDEMENYAMLKEMDKHERINPDVAIKYRVRPMHDAFEQKFNSCFVTPNLDAAREACEMRTKANLKIGFRRQLFNGCPPRTFPPVGALGTVSSYTNEFSNPWRQYNKESTTHGLKFCFIQPKGVSESGVMKTPHMYAKESQIYGDGRGIQAFVRADVIPARINPKHY